MRTSRTCDLSSNSSDCWCFTHSYVVGFFSSTFISNLLVILNNIFFDTAISRSFTCLPKVFPHFLVSLKWPVLLYRATLAYVLTISLFHDPLVIKENSRLHLKIFSIFWDSSCWMFLILESHNFSLLKPAWRDFYILLLICTHLFLLFFCINKIYYRGWFYCFSNY